MYKALMLSLLSLSLLSNAESKKVFISNFDNLDKFANQILRHKYIELAKGEGVKGSNAVRVSYVPNNRGSERVCTGFNLGKPYKELTLNYDVKYDKDFDWGRGGKLHGLGPLKSITGGNKITSDGWSARLMFYSKGTIGTYTSRI